MYRRTASLEIFLVHPGGPFWAKKHQGAWSIPKGEYLPPEDPLAAARREFQEETGFFPGEPTINLGTIRQSGGKMVSAWAFEGDADPAALKSNLCAIDWPPRSGKTMMIPEVDEGRWFSLDAARTFLVTSQFPLLERLHDALVGS